MKLDKGIYWDVSWNITRGCTPVSAGCDNCWAKRMHHRTSIGPWDLIFLHHERLDQPLHWQNPRIVAVQFMGDLFHEQVPDEFIDKVFAVVASCIKHTFLLLTKRPRRMQKHNMEIPNLWLGVSVEDQKTADERIPLLLQTPAAHRFVSIEPMLSGIDMYPWVGWSEKRGYGEGAGLDWVILGGESGPKARPMDLDWVRSIVDQCREADVPVFVKQLHIDGKLSKDMNEWPEELRIRELPWGEA